MANPDAPSQQHAASRVLQPVKSHLAFTLLCALIMMVMFTLLRVALLVYNKEMILDTPASTFLEAFGNGLRFGARIVVYFSIPLLLALLSVKAMAMRGVLRFWLTAASSLALFLGLMEMDFYREFHQRLNGLVFQYVKEDPKTVIDMLWYGFPVVRYLLAWAVGTVILYFAFRGADRVASSSVTRAAAGASRSVARGTAVQRCLSCCCWCVWFWRVAPCVRALHCVGAMPTQQTPTSPTSWASTALCR